LKCKKIRITEAYQRDNAMQTQPLVWSWGLVALLLLITAPSGMAQETSTLLTRLTSPVAVDGLSDEPAWQVVLPLPMTQYEPTFEGPMTERTEMRIAYDDAYLYVAARCYDRVPDGIRANSLYRDRLSGDDVFGVILDTFGDRENARWFWTTPTGVRGDLALANDGDSNNTSWNTHWDVATVQNDDGWFAEMRIPYSSLGFQHDGGRVVMGLIAYRYIARKNERHVFPALSPDRSYATPSRAQDVVLAGIYSQRPLYVTPYALGGLGQTARLNGAGTAYHLDDEVTQDLGLDVKYNLTSNLTLDATVNTDFAQVEADDQQVNLTRFSLFFPEKRQFFQERSGIFGFGTLGFGADRLFHSRRIGLYEGAAIPIVAGARLVGRLGEWDVGLLDLHTARRAALALPSENFGVVRLRRRVFNPYSYAGGLVTSRLGGDGGYNVAYGLDAVVRLFGDDYLTVKWSQTFDDDVIEAEGFRFVRAGLAQVQLNRRRNVGLNYWFTATWGGPDFQPEMGFTTRRDFTELGWYVSYDWLLQGRTPWRAVSPAQFSGFVAWRNPDRSVESALLEYDTDFGWKSGAGVWADFEVHYENLRESLFFPEGTEVPAGSYWFFRHEGGFDMPPGGLFRADFDWGLAQFFDGRRLDLGVQSTWNASRFLELSGAYQVNFIRFPSRDQGFNAHIFRLRTQAALNTRVSTQAFIQYNSTADAVAANVRFRYNFREGNDLWIVYNEGLNMDRRRLDPVLPWTDRRTVLVKYTYTFAF